MQRHSQYHALKRRPAIQECVNTHLDLINCRKLKPSFADFFQVFNIAKYHTDGISRIVSGELKDTQIRHSDVACFSLGFSLYESFVDIETAFFASVGTVHEPQIDVI